MKTHTWSIFLIGIFLFMLSAKGYAQNITVQGNVTDSNGDPIIGATVMEKGTQNGTVTDLDGNFVLKSVKGEGKLVVSYIGMNTAEVSFTLGKILNITLTEASQMMEEIVAIGYASVKRKDLTGAVSSVGEKTLRHITSTNAASALTGRLAGVNVVTTQGSPDAEVSILVRGGGSITQSNEPLFIVDGFQVSSISDIPPTDIESIDVLKDASSTAIYGAKGANGVILVTTKSGREGKTEIKFNASVGFNNFYNETEVLSPYEYVYFQRELDNSDNAGFFDRYGRWEDIDIYKSKQGTDWQKKLFEKTGVKQNYNLSINGGNKDLVYSISYTRDDEAYILRTSNFRRDNLNIKLSKKLYPNLKLDFNPKMSYTVIDGPSISSGNKLRDCVMYPPIGTLTDLTDEDIAGDGDIIFENISDLHDPFYNTANEYKKQTKFSNSYNVGLSWEIIKGLTLRGEGTYAFQRDRTDNIWLTKTGEANGLGGHPVAKRNYDEGTRWTARVFLTYKKTFGDHSIDAMAGIEYNNSESENMLINSDYFPDEYTVNDILALWNNGTAEPTYTTIKEPSRTASYYGRLNYIYKGRYFATFTFRTDGTNVFAPGNQWGNFPAGALAWRFSDEPFMEDTKSWFSNGKLRVSYGQTGNARVGSYWRQTYAPITSIKNLYFWNETGQSSMKPSSVLRNENLTWETKTAFNVGLDLGFFNNKLNLNLDYYNDVTKNLIMSVDLPYTSGYNTQYQNLGQTTTRGFEVTLNANIINQKDFYLDFNFNIGFNKCIVDKLYGNDSNVMIVKGGNNFPEIGSDNYRVFLGQEVGLMYGYVCDGMYSFDDFTYDPVAQRWQLNEGVVDCSGVLSRSGAYYGPGHLKLKDLSGPEGKPDGKIDADNDRRVIGHARPKHTGGFGIQAGFKGFDLTALFNWSYGNDIFNASKVDYTSYALSRKYQNMSTEMSLANRFTFIDPETGYNIYNGQHANPELLQQLNQNKTMWHPMHNSTVNTDWMIEDGSFLRLGTLSLGYTLPHALTRKIGMNNVRFYVTGNNVFCLTGYSGQDPEVNTSTNVMVQGYDRSAYPKSRAWIIGTNITF